MKKGEKGNWHKGVGSPTMYLPRTSKDPYISSILGTVFRREVVGDIIDRRIGVGA